ncbi:MAG: DUF560 domain-containing protein [Parvibaculum sp.]|nr:DUF560 domain-containing protein [Parvibaculum sp.]
MILQKTISAASARLGRAHARPLALALGLALLAAGTAGAGALDEARQKMAAGDAAGAYEILKPEERAHAGNPDFDYMLGLAAIDSGHAPEAVAAFERVLAVKPDHLQARAELGRAYIALAEPEAARRELATVEAQGNVPPEVRATINRYVTALDTGLSGGGTEIKGNLRVTAGWDSNINNSTSDARILIPAFAGLGFATLGPGAVSQDSAFAEVAGRVSVRHGISIDRHFVADITASYRGNETNGNFDQGIAGLNLGIVQRTPDWGSFGLSAQMQAYWVDDEAYRYTFGALGQWSITTRGNTDYAVYLQYARLNYPNNSIQNANRYTAGATIGQALGGARDPYVFAGTYAGTERVVDSAVRHLSNDFAGLRAGGEIGVMDRLRVHASASVEFSKYDAPDPLFLTERSTTRGDAVVGLRYALTSDLTLGGSVAYTRSDSNIVLYDYDRTVASVSLNFDF